MQIEKNKNTIDICLRELARSPAPVICYDEEVKQKAIELLKPVFAFFQNVIENLDAPLVLIYFFRHSEQTSPDFVEQTGDCIVDGMASVLHSVDGNITFSAIGLSVEAIFCDNAKNYVPFLFLHELTHIIASRAKNGKLLHGESFHRYLDYLIQTYNSSNGSLPDSLLNDYFGLYEE